MSENPHLSKDELKRYARHISLPLFGIEGQNKLRKSSVLCIGAGGLGSPCTMYLAAAGIGKLGIIDMDVVDESNIQRQILHGSNDIGVRKIDSAKDTLQEINPYVKLELYDQAFDENNAEEIAKNYDIIIDGTDNFPSRYLVNDTSVLLGIPYVYGSIFRFEGQVTVFSPSDGGPCYRCLFPDPPAKGAVPD
ncbi:MAG: HesA/MoeB/ThiF family protein [Verrucomicrobiota bacterium]|nr:HesA/MoeB/ThiF family protein [Verrucomicrobiota bacterium]